MKNQKGITLVALVVTIVVLLILAGVTIALVMNGDSSIFGNARKAGTETNVGNVKELVSTAMLTMQTDYLARRNEFAAEDMDINDATKVGEAATTIFIRETKELGVAFPDGTSLTATTKTTGSGENTETTITGFSLESDTKDGKYHVVINTAAETPSDRLKVTEK